MADETWLPSMDSVSTGNDINAGAEVTFTDLISLKDALLSQHKLNVLHTEVPHGTREYINNISQWLLELS